MQAKRSKGPNQGSPGGNVVQSVLPFHRENDHPDAVRSDRQFSMNRQSSDVVRTISNFSLYPALTTLIDRLDSSKISSTGVIRWGAPVPSFGDLSEARVATLGLNPSNLEFVDRFGEELQGTLRRFHTLASLGLRSWADVDARHLRLILESCNQYFLGNPYDRWFKKLDQVVVGAGASFYNPSRRACHLDLIPYATTSKWTELSTRQRTSLLGVAGDTLGLLLRDSKVRVLILNGQSVVEQFQEAAGVSLERESMPRWSLSRRPKPNVSGLAYKGLVSAISGIPLPNEILVLGYNHNLQSSFGVTNEVIFAIRDWISQAVEGVAA
jgi:hypothetical protein